MKNVINCYYYVQNFELLNKARQVVMHYAPETKNIIAKDLSEFEEGVPDHSVVIINDKINHFQKIMEEHKSQSVLVIINDIVNDFAEYPCEAYISKCRIITSLGVLFYDLQNTHKFDFNYYSVKMENILINTAAPCDLYLKISDEKYLKCVHAGDMYDDEVKNRYQDKSEYIWVKKDDFFIHGNFLYGQEDLEQKVTVEFTVENQDHMALIYDMAHSCGITEETMKRVEESVQEIKNGAEDKIKSLIKRFDSLEGSFLHSHSYFTSLLCVELAQKQDWFKTQHIHKFVMVSMLHDLGFLDEKNVLYEGLPASKIDELDRNIKLDIIGHVDQIMEILEGQKGIDSDMVSMLKKHHGGRGEDSYPQKTFATELDLLSAMFILCHSFTVSFFKMSCNTAKVDKVLAYLELVYGKGSFKKIFPKFRMDIIELFANEN